MNDTLRSHFADLIEPDDPGTLLPCLSSNLASRIKALQKAVDLLGDWDDIDPDQALSMLGELRQHAQYPDFIRATVAELRLREGVTPDTLTAAEQLAAGAEHLHRLLTIAVNACEMKLRPDAGIPTAYDNLTINDLPRAVEYLAELYNDRTRALDELRPLLRAARQLAIRLPHITQARLEIQRDLAEIRVFILHIRKWTNQQPSPSQLNQLIAAESLAHATGDTVLALQDAYKTLADRMTPARQAEAVIVPIPPPTLGATFNIISDLVETSTPQEDIGAMSSIVAQSLPSALEAHALLERWSDMPQSAARSILADLSTRRERATNSMVRAGARLRQRSFPPDLAAKAENLIAEMPVVLAALDRTIAAYQARIAATRTLQDDLPLPRRMQELPHFTGYLGATIAQQHLLLAKLQHQDDLPHPTVERRILEQSLDTHAHNSEYADRFLETLKAWGMSSPTPSQMVQIDAARESLAVLSETLAAQMPLIRTLLAKLSASAPAAIN